jgi:hypothetical protein
MKKIIFQMIYTFLFIDVTVIQLYYDTVPECKSHGILTWLSKFDDNASMFLISVTFLHRRLLANRISKPVVIIMSSMHRQ